MPPPTLRLMQRWKDKPFMLYLAFYSVHTPLQARDDLVAKYKARAAKLKTSGPEFEEEEQVWPVDGKRKVRVRQNHAVYAAMVEAMDEQIGRLLDKLDQLRLADRTAVFFMSDNGGLSTSEGSPTSNVPLRGGKGWVYEGGIREPMIIRWPGAAKQGSTCDVPVSSIDFYPTILEMAGVPIKPDQELDGLSVVPLLKGADRLEREALFWHYPHYSNQGGFPGGAVRIGDWKLIERYEDGRVQLHNLADDIGEWYDLAGQQPERVAAMTRKLHRWYGHVGARFLEPLPGGPKPWRLAGRELRLPPFK